MDIIVRGKQLKVTPAIREYAQNKLSKSEKFFETIIKMSVELDVKKIRNKDVAHHAKVIISLPGKDEILEESDPDLYTAIDKISDKVNRQLKKRHEKMKIRPRGMKISQKLNEVSAMFSKNGHHDLKISKRKKVIIKPMDLQEALAQVQASKEMFLIFQNKISKNINALYTRKNGSFGLLVNDLSETKTDKYQKFLKALLKQEHKNGGPRLTKTKAVYAQALGLKEAAEMMKQMNSPYIIYRSAQTEQFAVLAKKESGFHLFEPAL
jgi:putative sigma-54 modulation protein